MYLGCILDETVSRISMALKVINEINSRLKFLHKKNKFLTPALRRLLVTLLFNLTLIMHLYTGILTPPKNEKQNPNHAKQN